MFDPKTGRFLSMDPRTPEGQEVLYTHPFGYARNNPVRYVDPAGTEPFDAESFWETQILPYLPKASRDYWRLLYQKGCVGLCHVRLSAIVLPHRLRGVRCFTDFRVALALRNKIKTTRACSGEWMLFAVQFHEYRQGQAGHPRAFSDPTEIDPDTIGIDEFNYATYWDLDPTGAYWECMNHGLSSPGAVVIHVPSLSTSKYPELVYCVVCARSKTDPTVAGEIDYRETAGLPFPDPPKPKPTPSLYPPGIGAGHPGAW